MTRGESAAPLVQDVPKGAVAAARWNGVPSIAVGGVGGGSHAAAQANARTERQV